MADALSKRGRRRLSVATEAGVWLAAACLLLAQIGCVSNVAVQESDLHLEDATFTPEFVKLNTENKRRSLPALVRYWVAKDQPFTVTWPAVRIGTDCNLCSPGTCPLPNPATVTVRFRGPMADSITETAQFEWLSGCPGAAGGPAVFMPAETGRYLAHIVVPDAEPTPSEPGAWFPINVLESSLKLPPRLLRLRYRPPPGGDIPETWEWTGRVGAKVLKEAFDPRLRVGRVSILVGTCSAPGLESRDDECGEDLPLDPAFTKDGVIAPQYVSARVTTEGGLDLPLQACRGDENALAGDGDIDFGPDPNTPMRSRCGGGVYKAFTPNYPSDLEFPVDAAGIPMTWRVEFSQPDFPPPDPGKPLWIEFTLVPVQ